MQSTSKFTEREATTGTAQALRILVADDNRDAADSFCQLLRIWGFDVQVAYDGEQAWNAVRTYRPDCVLADIGLPRVDGYRLAEHIRRDEALRNITLIAITAYSDAARAMAAGFDHHFVKPADPRIVEELLRKLRAMRKRLDQSDEVVRQNMDVISEARDVMKEVKQEVREMHRELREVKDDVKEIRHELREVKDQQARA